MVRRRIGRSGDRKENSPWNQTKPAHNGQKVNEIDAFTKPAQDVNEIHASNSCASERGSEPKCSGACQPNEQCRVSE